MVVGSQENPVTICQAALMKPITSDAVVPGTQHGTKDRKMDSNIWLAEGWKVVHFLHGKADLCVLSVT